MSQEYPVDPVAPVAPVAPVDPVDPIDPVDPVESSASANLPFWITAQLVRKEKLKKPAPAQICHSG